jgi:GNAT superfamily N-acetyltransferase
MAISFRPAQQADHAAMVTLCAQIWDGHDYIPDVWEEWLADPHGQFTAVLADDHLIGLGKLTLVTGGEPSEWWLEGLRLDPAYRGQGVGTQLHNYNVDLWKRIGGPGVLRLLTHSENKAVQHLCDQTGFRWVTQATVYRADPIAAEPDSIFQPITPQSAASAYSSVPAAYTFQTLNRLFSFDHLWKWAELTPKRLTELAADHQAWLWRERAVVIGEQLPEGDSPLDNEPCLFLGFWGAAQNDLTALLIEVRQLTPDQIGLVAPVNDPVIQSALAAAGYTRQWESSFHLYEVRQ